MLKVKHKPAPDSTTVRGELQLVLRRNRKTIAVRSSRNLVVNTGLAALAGLANGLVTAPFAYLALGTSNVAPSPTQTALGAEITTGGGARALASVFRTTKNVHNDTAQWVRQWTFTAPFAITESGIFNAPSGGLMLSRLTFDVVNVQPADELELTWNVWFERG